LGEGRALESICADPDMPTAAAVRRWVSQDRDDFAARYQCMRELGCITLAERMVKCVDDRRGMVEPRVRYDGSIDWVIDPDQFRRVLMRCDVYRMLLSRRERDTYGSCNGATRRRSPR
jgi:hypothetical protein